MARGAGCSCNSRGKVNDEANIKVCDGDKDEGLYDDKSVKYDEDDDVRDDSNREVDVEINSTVSNRLK